MVQTSSSQAFGKFFEKTKSQQVFGDASKIIRLQPKKETLGESISRQLETRKTLPQPLKTLSSPTLTAGAAGTLAGLATGSPITGLKTFGVTGLGLGIATKSPKLVDVIQRKAKPVKAGEFIGETIEGIGKKTKDTGKSFTEKLKTGLKTAGLIGGGAVLAAGAVAAAKKIKSSATKIPQLPKTIAPQASIQATAPGVTMPSDVAPQIQAFGPAKKEAIAEAPVAATPTINNRISVKPEINISFRRSKKFINQQILIRK